MTEIAKMIDHTLLKPESTKEQIVQLCKEARQYGFATVCINPTWVSTAAQELEDFDVGITTVIGFPLGATTSFTKVAETRDAIANGATEIDMVMNVGALKSKEELKVYHDIKQVVQAASGQAVLKVILETGLLTNEEKILGCQLAKEAGADFEKTSTGFGPGKATVEDINLMREAVGPQIGVKASGGIRDSATAVAMIEAGANRIGASAGIAIITGETGKSEY